MAEMLVIGGPGFSKGKKGQEEEPAEKKDEGEEDLGSQTKKAAAKALIGALKRGDESGVIKALDAYMDCGYGDEEE